jgi:zinc-binding alcohol dehydrogenase family protein
MKAVAYTHCRPVSDPEALVDIELPEPLPRHRDLLVEVKAISVNPVDTKLRRHADPVGEPRVLGFDAAGIVRGLGPEVTHFGLGDHVFYAGNIGRPGSYAEFQLVDERIVGRKPHHLSWAEAAAIPLAGLTAWEMLFDRLQVPQRGAEVRSLLIIGAAGGVGSIATQLASRLTALRVIATAGSPESKDWCLKMGAHAVIDHHGDIPAQLAALGHRNVDYIFGITASDHHWPAIVRAIRPQGKVGLIDDPQHLDILELKPKSVSLHWEGVFTRSSFETEDMIAQHHILNRLAALFDDGTLKSTVSQHLGGINAANLRHAHALIEGGHVRGKLVLEGFS